MNNVTKLSVVLAVVLAVAGFVTIASDASDAAAQTTVAVNSEDDFAMASDTVYQLSTDVTLSKQLTFNGVTNVTLDLNGNKLTISGYRISVIGGGSLTITDSAGDGTIYTNTDYPLYVSHGTMNVLGGIVISECPESAAPTFGYVLGSSNPDDSNYSTLTIGPNAHLNHVGTSETYGGNDVFGAMIYNLSNTNVSYGATINLNCKTTGITCLAYVQGNIKATDGATPTINITGGDYEVTDMLVYGAGFANYNITGGTFDCGNAGVEVRAGNLNISDATFMVHASPATAVPNGNGSTSKGCAIAISTHETSLPISADIRSGSFTAYWPLMQVDVRKDTSQPLPVPSLSIAGGTFNSTASGDSKIAVFTNDCSGFITGGTFSGILKTNVEGGDCIAEGYNLVDGEVENESTSHPSVDDDEDLPPFIPAQPAEDDDTVTIVACAAAAAVAAIMAVFLIIDRKG